MLRIGQGYDLHRIVEGRKLMLGGVEIENSQGIGLLGHSDADVLLHSITDAVLGSAAKGDIGRWFPDNDPAYAGADSRILLKKVLEHPDFAGWKLINLDCTVIAQTPKLAPHIDKIRTSIASIFQCPAEMISVKAKTNEGVDAVGEKQAIAAWTTLLCEITL
jgi:2-C-methyl-D-erythritol 2,4-cyclodiphosphate synthase